MLRTTDTTNRIMYTGTIVAAMLCLYLSSLNSYLLFHSLVEISTIIIAFALFTLTWNTSRFLPTGCLKILGIGYGFIAHTCSLGKCAITCKKD